MNDGMPYDDSKEKKVAKKAAVYGAGAGAGLVASDLTIGKIIDTIKKSKAKKATKGGASKSVIDKILKSKSKIKSTGRVAGAATGLYYTNKLIKAIKNRSNRSD